MVLRIIEIIFLIPTTILMWMSQYDHSSTSLSTFIGAIVFDLIIQTAIFFVACSLVSEYEIIEQSGPYCSEYDSNDFTPV